MRGDGNEPINLLTRKIDWTRPIDSERAREAHLEHLRREEQEAAQLKEDLESSMRSAVTRGQVALKVRRGNR